MNYRVARSTEANMRRLNARIRANIDSFIPNSITYSELMAVIKRLNIDEATGNYTDILNGMNNNNTLNDQCPGAFSPDLDGFPGDNETANAVVTFLDDGAAVLTDIAQFGAVQQVTFDPMVNVHLTLCKLLKHPVPAQFNTGDYRSLVSIALISGYAQARGQHTIETVGLMRPPLQLVYTSPLSVPVNNADQRDCKVVFVYDSGNPSPALAPQDLLLDSYAPHRSLVFWDRIPPMPANAQSSYQMLRVAIAALQGAYVAANQMSIDGCYAALTSNKDVTSNYDLPAQTAQRMYTTFSILAMSANENSARFKRNVARMRRQRAADSGQLNAFAALCAMDPLATAQAMRVLQQAQAAIIGQTAASQQWGFVPVLPGSSQPDYTNLWNATFIRVTNSQMELMKRFMDGSVSLKPLRL